MPANVESIQIGKAYKMDAVVEETALYIVDVHLAAWIEADKCPRQQEVQVDFLFFLVRAFSLFLH